MYTITVAITLSVYVSFYKFKFVTPATPCLAFFPSIVSMLDSRSGGVLSFFFHGRLAKIPAEGVRYFLRYVGCQKKAK